MEFMKMNNLCLKHFYNKAYIYLNTGKNAFV